MYAFTVERGRSVGIGEDANLDRNGIVAEQVKAESGRRTIEVVEDAGEDVASRAKALAALPHHLHGLVYLSLLHVIVVYPRKEEPVHAQLGGVVAGVGGKGLRV